MSNIKFTDEEVREIGKKLSFIVNDWAKSLLMHVINQAKSNNVGTLYMNTSQTLIGGANEGKTDYFYERLPEQFGFIKENVDLRGRDEVLWAYHLNKGVSSSSLSYLMKIAQKIITLDQIPRKYQGAVISMLGRKNGYTIEELRPVLAKIEESEKKNKKPRSNFFYDWNKKWSGGQRFRSEEDTEETVVLQRISTEWHDVILGNAALKKFWAFLLSQPQHFNNDVIGFALVDKISNDVWVLNEIQTDVINVYRRIIGQHEERKSIDIETLRDMLTAQNKKNWIPYIDNNVEFRNKLLENPNDVNQLCDDTQDINEFIRSNNGGVRGMNLIQHFQGMALKRILLIG